MLPRTRTFLLAFLAAPLGARAGFYNDFPAADGWSYTVDLTSLNLEHVALAGDDLIDAWPQLCLLAEGSSVGDACDHEDPRIYDTAPVAGTYDGCCGVVGATQAMQGLDVHREVYVPEVGPHGFARVEEHLHNPTGDQVTVEVRQGTVGSTDPYGEGDLGTVPESAYLSATSDGDTSTAHTGLRWYVASDLAGQPAAAVVLGVVDAPVAPHTLYDSVYAPPYSSRPNEITHQSTVVVPAGETVILVTFVSVKSTNGGAEDFASWAEDGAAAELWEGMRPDELGKVANWNLGPSLALSGRCGATMNLDFSGFAPGGRLAVMTSGAEGGAVIPGGDCAGTPTGLDAAGLRLRGTFWADPSGSLLLTPHVPAGACGQRVQALDLATCSLTAVGSL